MREGTGPEAPSTTWTYLVNDDPFRHTIGSLLAGPGRVTVAIYAAAVLPVLLLAWAAVDRLRVRRRRIRL